MCLLRFISIADIDVLYSNPGFVDNKNIYIYIYKPRQHSNWEVR